MKNLTELEIDLCPILDVKPAIGFMENDLTWYDFTDTSKVYG